MIEPILKYKADRKNLWKGEYKIPWDEPGFSERMLKEHLSQSHNMASRKDEIIDSHVQWIHKNLLQGKTSHVLDVGCGPGLYIEKLNRLGHTCSGIDFSPASVAYAQSHCGESDIRLGDVREVEYKKNQDLVMLLFGELNAFSPDECKNILNKVFDSLKPGGVLLLEPSLFDTVKRSGNNPSTWFRNKLGGLEGGLFSENPYIGLVENHWFEDEKVALTDYWIFEEGNEKVLHYANTLQGYTDQEYKSLLEGCHFQEITFWGDFGKELTSSSDFQAISATRK